MSTDVRRTIRQVRTAGGEDLAAGVVLALSNRGAQICATLRV
jgi:hypothetical protein